MPTLRQPREPSRSDVTVVSADADGTERITPLGQAAAADLVVGRPVREFRMRKGQTYWSGSYWCATTGDLEVYESRLELARLLLADFDPQVADVLPQPFTLHTTVAGKPRRHVPDFLFTSGSNRATVVDVKPWDRLSAPRVAPVLAWTREAVERKGWTYEVWSGVPDVRLANVRFLAGYRVPMRIDLQALHVVRAVARPGDTVGEVLDAAGDLVPPTAAKPALLHRLWLHELTVDLDEPLVRRTVLLPGDAR